MKPEQAEATTDTEEPKTQPRGRNKVEAPKEKTAKKHQSMTDTKILKPPAI
jgi:hypothetical protein